MTLRIDPAVAAIAAYHVPQPRDIRVKLDANELAFTLPAELRARLAGELAEVPLERYPDPRARELRAIVAAELGVGGDQLVFGNGSDELIGMLAAALAGPVAYPAPTFVYYALAAAARGRPSIALPLDARFELDEAAAVRAIDEARPAVVFLALPNNPTGTLWRMDFALELAARFRDIAIVSDEAYFAYSGRTNLPQLAAHPNLIVMRTLSKVGFAGLRVGYTVSSPAIAELLDKVRPPYNLSALDQRAAVFALRECRAWSAARAAEIVVERGRLAIALARLGFEVFASEANLLLVRRAGAGELWKQLAARGILVRDFDRPGPLAGCLRITVGTPDDNAALVTALTELCAT
ncbi:MAG TPA: histidinol-phosphate transaminase [Kofleriaceae bacterium]|nr:histidinol-phosphate transaminase [Kofleriaceae bacterium]